MYLYVMIKKKKIKEKLCNIYAKFEIVFKTRGLQIKSSRKQCETREKSKDKRYFSSK